MMKNKGWTLMGTVIVSTLALATSGCSVGRMIGCMGKTSLKVLNWGEYIDMTTVREFEKEHGICVNYVRIGSAEEAVLKLENETFDVVVTSDYAIEELAVNDQLLPLDWAQLDITDDELNEQMMEVLNANNLGRGSDDFDMLQYGAPYMWGEIGIVYNTTTVDEEDLTDGWEVLRNNKYKVVGYDSPRDAFVPAFSQNDIRFNTELAADFDVAKAWLLEQNNRMGNKLTYLTDAVLDAMIEEKHDAAMVYSGDAIYIMSEQENMGYYRPADKATNVFVDFMAIPASSKKSDLAHQFINKMMSYEASLANSSFIGYTSARQDVTEELAAEDFADFADIYNLQANELDQLFRYSKKNKELLMTAWTTVRANA